MENYRNFRLIGGICAIAGGAFAIADGLQTGSAYLILGFVSIALGGLLVSKK